MKNFKTFISEATFNTASIAKVAKLLRTLLAKKLHLELFRFGGPDGWQEIVVKGNKGIGLLLFTGTKKAIRINFVNNQIYSMSLWSKFTVDAKADFTIELEGLNVVELIDTIVGIIKKPKVGNIDLYFAPTLEGVETHGELITEARRAKPEEFYKFCKELFPNAQEDDFDWHMLDAVGKHNDVQIPGYVRGQKIGKNKFNIAVPGGVAGEKAEKKKPEAVWHIAITGKDPVSGKFFSAQDNKEAAEVMQQIKKSLDPAVVPTKAEIKDPDTLFGKLNQLTGLVLRGVGNSLFVYGGPGIGKTFTITDTIKDAGLVKNTDWYHIKGKVTATALYQTLFIHRQGKLIVFDDADSAFGSEDSANILKGALDSYEERFISWNSARTINIAKMSTEEREEFYQKVDDQLQDDPANPKIKFPSEFKYEGRVIFISNLSAKEIDSAILSRSFKIDMTLTDEQIFKRIENLIDHMGPPDTPKEKKLEVLAYLKEKHMLGELANPNLRMFTVALKIANSGLPDWYSLLEHT